MAIVVGALVALAAPRVVLAVRPLLEPAFAVTMMLIGSLVRAEELTAFRSAPSRPVVGLVAQYTVMPLLAAAISSAFEDPVVRTGIVLVGCMPGAMASNVMTVLLGGDLVLSVTLTTLATLLCPIVLALWLPLLADMRLAVDAGPLVWNATWMVVLPVSAGIALRRFVRRLPRAWDRVATTVASASIVLIVLVVVAANRERLLGIGPALAVAMLALNLGGYALAYGVATLLRWSSRLRRTLIIEVGMQNAGLGSVLALRHLGAEGAVPSALYTVLCVITASLALPIAGRLARQPSTSGSVRRGR